MDNKDEKEMQDYLERQERQQKFLRDQYNSLDNPYNEDDYKRILHADLEFSPKPHQTWESYAAAIIIYAKMNAKKNIQTHINGPKGAWYTHRNPAGCFACEDSNLISVLVQTINLMAQTYPKTTFTT